VWLHSRQENQQTEVRTQELKMTKAKQQSANKLWLCTKQIRLKNYGFGIYSASGFSSSLFTYLLLQIAADLLYIFSRNSFRPMASGGIFSSCRQISQHISTQKSAQEAHTRDSGVER